MDNGFNYYRIKTVWEGEAKDQSLTKKKSEELVYATSYTEAEKIAHALIEDQQRAKFSDSIEIEIVKTKIEDILYNDILATQEPLVGGLVCSFFEESDDTGVGLYAVKVMFIEIDEKTAKEKRRYQTIYTPATSNSDANERVRKYLESSVCDYVVRDAKFDKAEAILWPSDIYKSKTAESIA